MNEQKVGGLAITVPAGSAFAYETSAHALPLHQVCLVIGKRGCGKSVAAVNMMTKMFNFDRVFIVSPTIASNKELMQRLRCAKEDAYHDPSAGAVESIKQALEQEAKDLSDYKKKMAIWRRAQNRKSLDRVSFEELDEIVDLTSGEMVKPKHRWNGRKPCCCVLFDDCLGDNLLKSNSLIKFVIYHRHLGQLDEGGAIGCSCFFLVQSYMSSAGGLSPTIRRQATSVILFKTKSEKELECVAEECSGEVSRDTFLAVYEHATAKPYSFLLIDFHKKKTAKSMFRMNMDTYLLVD